MKASGPERARVAHAVVGRIGIDEVLLEARGVGPVERAAVHDDAADDGAVAADPLGGRVDDDVRAERDAACARSGAQVLSTNSGRPFAWATSATARMSATSRRGLPIVSRYRRRVLSSMAAA